MDLSHVVPIDRIEADLGSPVEVHRVQTANLQQLLRSNPSDIFGIAASTWHRLVMAGHFKVKPMQMRQYFEKEDPALAHAIEVVIGKPMLKEFGALEANARRSGRAFEVATSCVAHLYSNELHLYDIAMADPRRPIPRRARKSDVQHHRGFGLLPEVMANVFTAARERGCSVITLTAADRPLVDVFSRYGFVVEDNDLARQAIVRGLGIPMEAAVE